MRKGFSAAIPLVAAAALCACGSGDDSAARGQLLLAITDAPVDSATAVVVQFSGVEVQPASGGAESFDFDSPRSIDLLALSGHDSELLLDGVDVPAGRYSWVRLKVDAEDGVDDSYIVLENGERRELAIPSGDQTGLKLNNGFEVPAGGTGSFTVDFDLRKSVHEPMNADPDYLLRPTLRIVDNTQVGAIAGTVAPELLGPECAPAVYVFAGGGVIPDDVDGTAPEPVTTARVAEDGTYAAAFLTEGTYTAAFTCDAAADDPATGETLEFSPTQTVNVTASETTTVNFPPSP